MMLLSKVPQWWFAAGNDNIDVNRVTPGGCEQVISVAANDSSANRAVFPNYVDKVDVIAPEVNIISITMQVVIERLVALAWRPLMWQVLLP